MKKIFTLAAAILVMALPFTLTSCDDDDDWYDPWYTDWNWGHDYNDRPNDDGNGGDVNNDDFFVAMAQTLAGQWRGTMRAYALDENGNAVDSIDYDTDIEFKQYNSQSVSGTGTQWDYEPNTNNCELQRDFTWSIDTTNGNINMIYKTQNPNGSYTIYTMTINYDDLNLDNRTFTGYLVSQNGDEVDDFYFNRYSEGTRAKDKKKAVKWVVKFVNK